MATKEGGLRKRTKGLTDVFWLDICMDKVAFIVEILKTE